jgi:hypothetical protein
MRVIKLSQADDEMKTRDACIAYFTKTIQRGSRRGKFGLTESKGRMRGITRGTLLLFCYKTELMFVARASGAVRATSWPYIPLKMGTLRQVSGSLAELERTLKRRKLIEHNLVNAQQWPTLSDACEPVVLAFVHSATDPDSALKLHHAMVELYHSAGREIRYWGKRYFAAVNRNGGLATAKRMLRRKSGGAIDAGLQKLKDFGRADELSVEAIVQRSAFRHLFTEEELAEARRRLDAPLQATKSSGDGPDETFTGAVIDDAVNPGRGRKGQRYLQDSAARKAIEDRGMKAAEKYLREKHFRTKNVCKKQSCDFRAYKDEKEYVVEVKATTGGGGEILVTAPEVRLHRKWHPANILIVVHGIRLNREGGIPKASGGTVQVYEEWAPQTDALIPMAYKCLLA